MGVHRDMHKTPEPDAPVTLADLAALRVNGPTLLILRPREPGLKGSFGLAERLDAVTKLSWWPKDLKPVVVSHGFDIMVIGDADLERMGYVRMDDITDGK